MTTHHRALGAFAVVFGLVTLVVGGTVLFDVGTARADHGSYVPFVLGFNWVSGFAYVAAGVGLWRGHRWAAPVATAIAAGLALTGAALGAHVALGGAYETRTIFAMLLRFVIWTAIALHARRIPAPA